MNPSAPSTQGPRHTVLRHRQPLPAALFTVALAVALALSSADPAAASNDTDDRPLLFGLATVGGNHASAAEVDAFTSQAGRAPGLRMEFWRLTYDHDPNPWPNGWGKTILTSHHDRGVTNIVEVFHPNIAQINNGSMDSHIHGMANTIADWVNEGAGRRLIIAPLPEPNLNHYSGASPTEYKKAWKRIHDIIVSKGLDDSEVRFAFWINGLTSKGARAYSYADWYPGDALVDIIGHSRLNRNIDGAWWDYDTVFTTHIEELQGYVGTHKPILVMQTGTVGGTSAKDGWLTDMMTKLRSNPQVIGSIYFNRNTGGHDFRILANGVLRQPIKNHIASWSHPSEADWIFNGEMDTWSAWRAQWLPKRIWGANRYATSAAISKSIYPNGTDTVYLAVGTNFPDSMVAGVAAASTQAPILLVETDSLPVSTQGELARLAPKKVIIVGGTSVVSQTVFNQVKNLLPGAQIQRHSGPNRYATSVEVSKAAFPTGANTVFVVTGENFPDALSATPPAVLAGGPLLLVQPSALPAVVAAELQRLDPDHIIIVGGTTAVSPAVEQALKAYAPKVTRVAAANRYGASAELSALAFPTPGVPVAYVALGTSFPDALAGGGTAGVNAGPMLLVAWDSIPSEVAAELTRLKPQRIVILGGPAVLSQKVVNQLAAYSTGG